jgi:hypothetical protein
VTGTQWLLLAVLALALGMVFAGFDAGRRRYQGGGSAPWFTAAVLGAFAAVTVLVLLINGAMAP